MKKTRLISALLLAPVLLTLLTPASISAAPRLDPVNPGTTGLVAWWSLDEASDTRYDSHGSNHLTDHNTVGSSTGVIGNGSTYISTNSEYLSGSNVALTSFTFSAWVKLSNKTGYPTIAGQWDNSDNNRRRWLLFYDQDSDRFSFWVSPLGTSSGIMKVLADNLGSPSVNTWYFITVSFASGELLAIRINGGSPNTTATGNAMYSADQSFCIGAICTPTPSFYLNGSIDEASIYNRVLSQDEIEWLYNSGNGRGYSDILPTPTPTFTFTPTETYTPSPTFTHTPTETLTPTFTPTYTETPTITPTAPTSTPSTPAWTLVPEITYGDYAVTITFAGLCLIVILISLVALGLYLAQRKGKR